MWVGDVQRSPEDIYDDTIFVTSLNISKYTPSSVLQLREVRTYDLREEFYYFLFLYAVIFILIFNDAFYDDIQFAPE